MTDWEHLSLPDADVRIARGFLARDAGEACFTALRGSVDWRRDRVRVFGRSHPLPRLHQWYGDPGTDYRWSGLCMRPQRWTDVLARVRDQVGAATGCRFNSVLVNLYRDGDDGMGWHADNEPEFGAEPVIASVSLGAERDFTLRRRDRRGRTEVLPLPHGSLLIMAGPTQRHWQHALPKRRRVREPRINLTFRYCTPSAARAGAS